MKINILLITYNQSNYIQQAMDSIVMQRTTHDVEIIVADDSSTDDTLYLIESYQDKTNFTFKFLPKEQNMGFVKNYLRGFQVCDGEYVAIMEGDDYWTDPLRLEKQITFLDNHRECVMSFNRIIFLEEKQSHFRVNDWIHKEDHHYITTKDLIKGNKIGNFSACVFRNSVLKLLKPDLFDLSIADWMIGMVIGQYGFIAELKEPTSVYRIHEKGLWSRKNSIEQTQEMIKDVSLYNKYLNYKYNDEFLQFENYLKRSLLKQRKYGRSSYIPPILLYIVKLFVPPVFFKK